ncbi:MAG: HlyD family secretion protein [Gammaproteobacteria bacterium]
MATSFSRTTRSLANDTSKTALSIWLFAGVFLGLWFVWFFFTEVIVYEISSAARLEVESAPHPVEALTAGKIASINLSLGQAINAGEILAELDANSEKLRLQEEESRLRTLPPQIAAIQNEIAVLQQAGNEDHQAALSAIRTARARHKEAIAGAEFAKDHDRRLRELSQSGRIAAIEALRVRSESQKLQASVDAYSSEIHRLEMDAKTREHDKQAEIENLKRSVIAMEGQIEVTKATIARLKQEIEKHLIRAPVSGQLGDVVPLQIGSYVDEGTHLATVVPSGELRIVAEFPPASVLGRIHPGQKGRMRLHGFPWAQYGSISAGVTHVATEIRDNQVRVEFAPDVSNTSPMLLQHGLPGTIEVNVEQVVPAILVLRAAGQLLSSPAQASTDTGRNKRL